MIIASWTARRANLFGQVHVSNRLTTTDLCGEGWVGRAAARLARIHALTRCWAVTLREKRCQHLYKPKWNSPQLFADGFPLHVTNSNHINTIYCSPTSPFCVEMGIVYTHSFSCVNCEKSYGACRLFLSTGNKLQYCSFRYVIIITMLCRKR